MSRVKTTILTLTIAAAFMAVMPADANADGPLRQWLRGLWGRNNTANTCNTCANHTAPQLATSPQTTANFAPNPYNLQPGQCMKTCQQTCSRTVVNYVPYTAYRTTYNRVPVTQYRPETKSDPCTGCTVTCMKPCTTYTYQMQRVPYTTYRPVYRQETYKVPVTTITNECATGTCNTGCNTCPAVGAANQAPVIGNIAPTTTNFAPAVDYSQVYGQPTVAAPQTGLAPPAPVTNTYYEQVPNGTLSPSGSSYSINGGNSVVPADTTPALQGVNPISSQRPFLDRFRQTGSTFQTGSQRQVQDNWSNAPARVNIEDKTASLSPVRKQWGYSPVRTASYTKPTTTRAQLAPIQSKWSENDRSSNYRSIKPLSTKRSGGWKEIN